MILKQLLRLMTETEIVALAKKIGKKPIYLRQAANGHKAISWVICRKLVKHEPSLKLADLRPDIYGPIK